MHAGIVHHHHDHHYSRHHRPFLLPLTVNQHAHPSNATCTSDPQADDSCAPLKTQHHPTFPTLYPDVKHKCQTSEDLPLPTYPHRPTPPTSSKPAIFLFPTAPRVLVTAEQRRRESKMMTTNHIISSHYLTLLSLMHMKCTPRGALSSYITVRSGNATLCRQISCEGREHGHRKKEGVRGAPQPIDQYTTCAAPEILYVASSKKNEAAA